MTPIYSITYPTGTDYVKDAPLQMQVLAQTVETALSEVDARATPAGATPVIATMYAVLKGKKGVRGQIGYVYSDTTPSNNGVYVYTGTAWNRIRTMQIANIKETDYSDSTWSIKYACNNGNMWISIYCNSIGTSGWSDIQCQWVIPEGYRPLIEMTIQPVMQNNTRLGSFTIGTDGTIKFHRLGGSLDVTDTRSCTVIYPVPTTTA